MIKILTVFTSVALGSGQDQYTNIVPQNSHSLAKETAQTSKRNAVSVPREYQKLENINSNDLLKAAKKGDAKVVKALLDKGADPNIVAKNGDTEMNTFIKPMPLVSFEKALAKFEGALTSLLDKPITSKEIDAARQRNAAHGRDAARGTRNFLRFLENVASDGLRPISPSTYAKLIKDTTDAEVFQFMDALIKPSATSILFAKKED